MEVQKRSQERFVPASAEAEERYQTLVRLCPDPIVILQDDRYKFVSPAFIEVFGYTQQEVDEGLSFFELVQEHDREAVRRQYEDRLTGNRVPKTYRIDLMAKDGTVIPCETSATLIHYNGIPADLVLIRDITERIQAEEALRKAHDEMEQKVEERTSELLKVNEQLEREIRNREIVEKKLRESRTYLEGILKAAPMGIGLVNNRVFAWLSYQVAEMLGYSENELIGKSVRIVYESDEDFERVGKIKYAEIQERGIGTVETRLKRKDGSVIEALLCSSAIDPSDVSKGTIFTALDITKRKQAEQQLRESQKRYRSLFKNNHSVMLLIDPANAEIVDANPAACSFYGWNQEELTSMKITDINMLSNEQVFQEMERVKSEERNHFFFRHRLASEEIRDVEVYSGPIIVGGKELLYSIIHDISERKRAERALQESGGNFRALAENANDGILIAAGEEGVNVYANKRAAEITGYSVSELLKIGLHELVASDEVEEVSERYKKRLMGEEVTPQYEASLVKKSGEIFPVELSSARTVWEGQSASIVIIRDIAERKKAEDALRHREAELKVHANELKEVNTALRVLLKRREEDKTELEEKILTNVKELVTPCLEKLKSTGLTAKQSAYVDTLESNLTDIISPFARKLSTKYLSFTPMEIQIANLVKEGRTTKEIAEMLNSSSRTIESHRKSIRKKIGIAKRKVNLRSHLLAM
jgi:PAS domain S-box-containing protein